jgi:hypothetical protein
MDEERGRREGATGEQARALVDGLVRLVQRRDAGAIDAEAFEAEARALMGAAPAQVVRAARQLALGVRAVLRPERSGVGNGRGGLRAPGDVGSPDDAPEGSGSGG